MRVDQCCLIVGLSGPRYGVKLPIQIILLKYSVAEVDYGCVAK